MNVEALKRETSSLKSLAIFQAVHRNEIADALCFLWRQNLAADIGQQIEYFPMTPNAERITVLECHTHHPDAAHKMVGVGMGDEEVTDVLTPDSCFLQLGKNSASTSNTPFSP